MAARASQIPETRRSFLFPLAIGFLTLFLLMPKAVATIDVNLQMQLGNPSGAMADPNNHDHYLIQRSVEAIDYNDNHRQPNWASWDLTSGDVGSSGRSGSFFPDTNLPSGFYVVQSGGLSGSGYDRGHMCPSDDRTDNTNDNDMVFFMSNIIPQAPTNNQGVWGNFETYCRSEASAGNEILITCGPSKFDGGRTASSGSMAIPDYTWKIAVVVPLGAGTALSRITASTRVITIKIPNSNSVVSTWQTYVTSAHQIELDTGYTFFTAVAPAIASALRSQVDGQTSPAPSITSFSPGGGAIATTVVITGNNFTSASAVKFNGVNASYTVDSATQITTTVPSGASSGPISVTTPSGTATSASSYTVTGLAPDLAIAVTHTNGFTQGDLGDHYIITVSSVGSSATSGTVSVADTLPSGLTLANITGSGWTINLGTLTCTRSDSLNSGSSFPPIIVSVNVSANAPASVTNVVNLSGGSDTNTVNNSASDATAIATASSSGTNIVVLAGWDVYTQTNFGASPLASTTNASGVTTIPLVRGAGLGTSGTGASNAFGASGWGSSTSAAAIAANQFITCGLAVNSANLASLNAISIFNYRRSGSGPTNGLLQYQVGSSGYNDITNVAYPSSSSSGAALGSISLAGIAALQNVGPGTNIMFRIVNTGATSSGGTWYIFDVGATNTPDFAISGALVPLTPIQAWRQQYFGTIANSGAAADSAISSSDHMPNLLKYALGLNPLVATNSPIVADISTGHLRMTVPKNPAATDVSYYVEVTGDLTTSFSTAGTTIDLNTSSELQAHDNIDVGAAGERFVRLRVSRP